MTIKSKLLALMGMAEAVSMPNEIITDGPAPYRPSTIAYTKKRKLKKKKKLENKARATQARINKTWK